MAAKTGQTINGNAASQRTGYTRRSRRKVIQTFTQQAVLIGYVTLSIGAAIKPLERNGKNIRRHRT